MKSIIILTAIFLLNACILSNEKKLYAIRLLNNEILYSESKPELSASYYIFDDINQQQYQIKEDNVLSIYQSEFKK